MSEFPAPACVDECRPFLLSKFRELSIEANVSHLPPLVASGYDQLDMRCPHGVLWYAEPTSEQISKWAEAGVA